MTTSPATFVWYELMTTDLAAAERFYAALLGWRPQPWGPAERPYTLMKAGETMVAGMMPLLPEMGEQGGGPTWLGYVGVGDVDAAARALTKAGGQVHRPPADIPDVGRFAVVADPQGAAFMLFTPLGAGTPPPPMTPGHVGWHELTTTDWEAAWDFYAGQFGWAKTEAVDMGPMGTYQTFASGGVPTGGMMNRFDAAHHPAWLYYVTVPEAGAAAARVTEHGGTVLMSPHQVPGGSWIAPCQDPQGARFAVVAPKP